MSAATIMLRGGIGLLRTMPPPREAAIATLRQAARGLGIRWPDAVSAGRVLAPIDTADPRGAAFVDRAAELMRGARYTAFDGAVPSDTGHGAVAATYAHVTAPLRRLADRYATEVCLCLAAGEEIPDWVRRALPRLPDVMQMADRRASAAEPGAIDQVEAVLLADRVGEDFDAAVLDVDGHVPPMAVGNTRRAASWRLTTRRFAPAAAARCYWASARVCASCGRMSHTARWSSRRSDRRSD